MCKAWVIVFDLAILGGKSTLNSYSLPNVQCMHMIEYKFWYIRRILQHGVFITKIRITYCIYVAIWTILFTFYHVERMLLEN